MDAGQLLSFALAYLGIVIVPGPGVTALIARVLTRGTGGVGFFIAGFVIGSLIWLTAAILGLATVIRHVPFALLAIRYSGALYLLYLAWRLWLAPVTPLAVEEPETQKDARKLVLSGMYINLGNPKSIIFFAAVLPAAVDVNTLSVLGYLVLVLVVAIVATSVLSTYAVLSVRARSMLSSPTSRSRLNHISAGIVAAVAITMPVR